MPLWKRNLFVCWFGTLITSAGLSLVIPFLPLFIEQLGVHETAAIERWSGVAFGASFLLAAIVAPLWGRLADSYGRKLMLLRASLGMAIVVTMIGFSQNVYQLVGLRLLMGVVSGFVSASIALVATQTPKEHAGWALGTLSTGQVGGGLLGPLIGGYLAELIGLRHIFFVTGSLLFCAFLITQFFVHEQFVAEKREVLSSREVWQVIPNRTEILALFFTAFMLQVAYLSIEPIVTIYIKQLVGKDQHVAMISGAVFAASGLATFLVASHVGRLSDRVGPRRVLFGALIAVAILFIPQAYVHNPWQLMGLRFLLGMAASGLLPSIHSLIKQLVPDQVSGRIYGYNQSAQFLGSIVGPVLGGQMAAVLGIRAVFFSTSILLLLNAAWVFLNGRQAQLHPAIPGIMVER